LQINFYQSIGLIDHLFHSALHAIRFPALFTGAISLSIRKGCTTCWIVKPFSVADSLSQKVMTAREEITPRMELYSINEMFLNLTGIYG